MSESKSLQARMLSAGIRMVAHWSDAPMPEGFDQGGTSWKVTFTRRGSLRRLMVPFHMGSAHVGEPEAEDVMDCLLSDASMVENSRGFADFAAELGYDEDSRKAERIYNMTVAQTAKLRLFLADDYKAFVWETERL